MEASQLIKLNETYEDIPDVKIPTYLVKIVGKAMGMGSGKVPPGALNPRSFIVDLIKAMPRELDNVPLKEVKIALSKMGNGVCCAMRQSNC